MINLPFLASSTAGMAYSQFTLIATVQISYLYRRHGWVDYCDMSVRIS